MQPDLNGTYPEPIKHLPPIEAGEIEDPKQLLKTQLNAVSGILDHYPRTKEWVVGEKEAKKGQTKNRYTINAFSSVIGQSQLVIETLREFNFDADLIDVLYQKLFAEIKTVQDNIRHLSSECTHQIPQSIISKYGGQQPAWLGIILVRGTYQLAAEELAEIRNIDKENIPQMEQLLAEVKNDFGSLHEAYKKDLMDPKNGCVVTDEMVDDLEQLVEAMKSTLIEALNEPEERIRLAV